MDPNELLKLLDLDATPARPPDVAAPRATAHATDASESKSPTALEVDAWGLRRGRDLVAESERLQNAGADAFAAADFFAAGFEPDPTLVDTCADPRRHQFLAQLLDTPEYRALHAATRLDDTAAAIAAGHFAEQFARLKKEDTHDATRGPAPTGPTGEGDLTREMAALRAVGRAVAEAGKEVSELRDAAAALGLGPGQPGSNDPRAVAALFKRVRNDPGLATDLRTGGPVPPARAEQAAAEGGARAGRRGRRRARRRRRPAAALGVGAARGAGAGTGHPAADRRAAGHVPRAPRRRAGGQGADHRLGGRVGVDGGGEGAHREGARPGPGVGRPAAAAVVPASSPTPGTAASGCWPCRPAGGTRRRCATGCPRSSAAAPTWTCPSQSCRACTGSSAPRRG